MAQAQTTYPPLDIPKPLAEGLWIVDSGPISAFGLPLPVRMTAIRLANGDLLLHSPTRFSPALRAALERHGPIRHLLAPNLAHWMFLRDWQRALPDAVTWAAPGLRGRRPVEKAGLQIDREIGAEAPAAWAEDLVVVPVPGAVGFVELAVFHKLSRTLVLTDIVQNLEAQKLPVAARLVLRALGAAGPTSRPPVYLQALVKLGGGAAARAAAQRLVDLEPARLVMTHGRVIDREATARLQRSLAWLL